MRKVFLTLSLILASAVSSFSQGPIDVGWVMVTPSLPNITSGLVVFETFGFNQGGGDTSQAGVLPSSLTTNSVIVVSASDRLARDVGVAIANPQNTSVNVNLNLRRSEGSAFGTTTTITVPAMQQVSKFLTELFAGIPDDFLGTLTVTAPAPVSMLGLRFRGSEFSTIPITNVSPSPEVPALPGPAGGTGAVVLPQFAAGGGWATEIVLGNISATPMVVRVDLFKTDGAPLPANLNGQTRSSFTNVTIPAGGVVVLAPLNAGGDSVF